MGDELFNFAFSLFNFRTPRPIISGFLKIVDETLIINALSGQRGRPPAEPVPGLAGARPHPAPSPAQQRPTLTRSPGRGGRQPAQVDLILLHRPSEPRSPPATWYQSELARIPPPSLPLLLLPRPPLAAGAGSLLRERLRAAPRRPRPHFKYGRRAAGGPAGPSAGSRPSSSPALPSLPSPGDAAVLPARPPPRNPRSYLRCRRRG